MPFFSIITSTYNRGNIINKTIESVLAQTFIDYEYIIIDDGSSDNTKQVIEGYKNTKIKYHWIENHERGYARNLGVSLATGKYITFLDSDDIISVKHLQLAKEKIAANSRHNFLFMNYNVIDTFGKLLYIGKFNVPTLVLNLAEKNNLGPSGFFALREKIQLPLFDPDPKFSLAEDLYVWLKLFSRELPFISNEITVTYIDHGNNTMRNLSFEKVIYCRDKLIQLLKDDDYFMQKYSAAITLIFRSQTSLACDTLIAKGLFRQPFILNLKIALKYPAEFSKKRFWANMKNASKNIFN